MAAVSALALAGYAPKSARSGATSPPPFFPRPRSPLSRPDYSLPFPRVGEVSAQSILRAAAAAGHIDACADEMERLVHESESVNGGSGSDVESRLVAALMEQVDRHADVCAALREAEEAAATGAPVAQSSILSRLVHVGSRLLAPSHDPSSIRSQLKAHATRSYDLVHSSPLFDSMQHPQEWSHHLEQTASRSGQTRIERMLSSTGESSILALQNEQVTRSNASHARAAERAAAALRAEIEQQERREREERERAEQRVRDAEARARERAERVEQAEKARLRRLEEEQEMAARAEQAHEERIRIERAKAESTEAMTREPPTPAPVVTVTGGDDAADNGAAAADVAPSAAAAASGASWRSERKRRRVKVDEDATDDESPLPSTPRAATAAARPDESTINQQTNSDTDTDSDESRHGDDDDDATPLNAFMPAKDDSSSSSATKAVTATRAAELAPESHEPDQPLSRHTRAAAKKQKR